MSSAALPWLFMGGLVALWEFLVGDSLPSCFPAEPDPATDGPAVPPSGRNMGSTIFNGAAGFAAGSLFGLACSVGFVYNATFAKTVYPHTLVLRSLPLMACSRS
jgi:ABC-type nitrate/sulfonate/bicarbonate transport system permease component